LESLSGVLVDITGRKEAETMQILLAREVDHRARNALGVVQAIVRLARADTIEGYIRAVDGRIQALAHTHELLSKSRWQGADIERLISEELAPYREANARKVTLEGPSVILAPERAQAIGIVLHELATNAAKYGALSCEEGQLDVRWTNSKGVLTLNWKELGCSGIAAPTRRGFGTKIITSSLHQGNGGEARFDWQPTGLHFTLTLNSERKQAASKLSAPAAAGVSAAPKAARVLVVEDESLIGMLTMDMVKELGYATLGPLTNIADAAEVIERSQFDIAVIDLNLNGKPAYPLAEALDNKGVPFVFVTGYAPDSIDERFSHVPLIQKPIPREALAKALRQQLGAHRRVSVATG
jgi:two-component sensor histidine kinase/CheY-like chemotaxis protein